MVLIRNNVKKESTYGWYPSQHDVYQNPREKVGYDKEILFRHFKSQLHHTNPAGITPPETPPHVKRARARTATPRSQRGSKIEIRRPKTATSNIENPLEKLKIKGSKATPCFGVSFNTPSRAVSRSIGIPTPNMNKKYHWQPQPTIIGIVDPDGPFITKSPELDIDINQSLEGSTGRPGAPLPPQDGVSDLTPAQKLSGSFRVKSASLHRPKLTSARSIKSAGTRCKSTTIHIPLDSRTARDVMEKEESDRNLAAPSYFNQLKHEITKSDDVLELSPSDDFEEINARPITTTPDPGDPTNYSKQNQKYGWKMEVHGDPYRVKQPALPDRLPYTVRCNEPIVEESPFKCKVMVGETFFSNTIPRRHATFSVHPEWQSEHFVEQRKELEKQGRKFHVRNFGFIY